MMAGHRKEKHIEPVGHTLASAERRSMTVLWTKIFEDCYSFSIYLEMGSNLNRSKPNRSCRNPIFNT